MQGVDRALPRLHPAYRLRLLWILTFFLFLEYRGSLFSLLLLSQRWRGGQADQGPER